jgi:thiosulfate dehydrogenase
MTRMRAMTKPAAFALSLCVAGCGLWSRESNGARQAAKSETTTVELCDGETATEVPKGMAPTRENGERVAADLMAQWQRKHPDENWIAAERTKHSIVEPADNAHLVGKEQGQTYGRISERDVAVWKHESLAMVTHGSTVFHSGDELGSTIGVSCDMCHPDASNTHPETYPKFQPQLGRVALLRDMINWCIEHPVRGQKLAPDDPKMRALEAYIYAQRKGKTLNYGAR